MTHNVLKGTLVAARGTVSHGHYVSVEIV